MCVCVCVCVCFIYYDRLGLFIKLVFFPRVKW